MTRKLFTSIALILVLITTANGYAVIKQFTTANSLVSNDVYSVFRDSKGYLWFGTDKGVSCYDGVAFKTYSIFDGLGDNEVFKFYEDKSERLWVFTYNGSACYIYNGRVYNSNNDPLLKKMPEISYINAMYDAGEDGLYIGYYLGQIIKIKKNEVIWVEKSTKYNAITAIYPSGREIDVASSTRKIIIKNDKVISVVTSDIEKSFLSAGKRLCTSSSEIKVYTQDTLQYHLKDPTLFANNVVNIYCSDNETIFFSRYNGLTIINFKADKRVDLLQNVYVTSVNQDIAGNYWITTRGNGVYYLNKDFEQFRFVKQVVNERLYYAKNGQVFFVGNGRVSAYRHSNPDNIKVPFDSKSNPLYNDEHIFLYAASGRSYLYNKTNSHTVEEAPYAKFVFPYLNDGLILIGPNDVYKARISKQTLTITDSLKFAKRIVDVCTNVNKRKLYILSANTLSEYDPNGNKIKRIDSFSDVLAAGVFAIGNWVVAVMNNRTVVVYDIVQHTRKVFTPTDIYFYSFWDLGDNSILVYTNKGYYLARDFCGDFNAITLRKLEYPVKQNDLIAMYPDKDSILCDINGCAYLFNRRLLNNKLSSPVFYIDKIIVQNIQYQTRKVDVKHAEKCNVSIYTSALGFNNLKTNFEYRIQNDKERGEWLKNDGTVINILLSGYHEYIIEVRAITENQIASEIQLVTVVLLPPFYLSWWFKILITGVIVVFIFIVLRFYHRRRQKTFQHELEFMQMEHKAINSLLNPHFIFNAINNIQNIIVQNEPEKATEYLAMLSRLIRQNIENLQFNFIPLEKEITLIKNYIFLQNLRFSNSISLEIRDNIGLTETISIPPLLIHTFIENSIVHGFVRHNKKFLITVELTLITEDYLEIIIKDNGEGLKKDNKANKYKTSLGIDFIRKRLERISAFYNVQYKLHIVDLATLGVKGTQATIMLYSRLATLSK